MTREQEKKRQGWKALQDARERDMATLVIIHAGGAHKDELIALGLVASLGDFLWVERRDPTEEELQNPDVWVLDVGMRHEPELRNFDHHQLPRDAVPTCAASLVADHLGVDLSVLSWWDLLKVLDSKGPKVAAKFIGLEWLPMELISPMDRYLIKTVSESTVVPQWVVYFMKDVVTSAKEEAALFIKEYALCNKHVSAFTDADGIQSIQFHQKGSPLVMSKVRIERFPEAAFSITSDDRGSGLAVFRFGDDPRIDFSKAAGEDWVHFAHVNGFLLKTKKDMPHLQLLDALRSAGCFNPGAWRE